MTSRKKVSASLAGSPATRPATSERRRDPRGDRYDHSQAFDARTSLSLATRRRGPVQVSAVAVADPFSPATRVLASANRNVDVRGSKDFSIAHERAIIYAIEDARLVAMLKDKIMRAIGVTGARFHAEVLTGRQTFAQYAEARGKGGERGTAYIAEDFRILLDDLDTEFAAVSVLQAIRAFQGEPTGEETDSRGRTVPAGQGVYFGELQARYAPQAKAEVRRAVAGRGRVRDLVTARYRVGGLERSLRCPYKTPAWLRRVRMAL
ncbi:hypothetical protein [Methylobacterium komagatae]